MSCLRCTSPCDLGYEGNQTESSKCTLLTIKTAYIFQVVHYYSKMWCFIIMATKYWVNGGNPIKITVQKAAEETIRQLIKAYGETEEKVLYTGTKWEIYFKIMIVINYDFICGLSAMFGPGPSSTT